MSLNTAIRIIILSAIINVSLCHTVMLTMPGVTSEREDSYLCASFPIPNAETESYIKSYESTTNSSVAHHILLYGCTVPYSTQAYYPCTSICGDSAGDGGKERIIFAWAKDAQKFEYPKNAAMSVGGNTGIKYFVLQVHYLHKVAVKDYSGMKVHLTYEVPLHLVNIALLFSYYGDIPANRDHVKMDISCKYKEKVPAYTLAFRTHAHALGRSISGFRVSNSNGQIDLIGRGNPQWPQTFYKANSNVMIMPGDVLMARCVFDSTGIDHVTSIGSTHNDEMCNFYIMLVSKSNTGNLAFSCGGNEFEDLWKNIPAYSMEYAEAIPDPSLFLSNKNEKKFIYNSEWKIEEPIGEISSVTILPGSSANSQYSLLVLHRYDRYWKYNTFKENIYVGDRNAISSETIFEIDPLTGKVLRKSGANLFFMPHGLTVTKDGKYIWVTDVALHQIMRFHLLERNNINLMDEKPDIILGERFVPGNDKSHFCKPAKVAVDSKGFIFVADGYCNSRVICFYPNGTYADEWRNKEMMIVVHSITIEEDKYGDIKNNIVWIADRENQKIIGFKYDGTVAFILSSKTYGMPIYAIEFNPLDNLIYGVSSNGLSDGNSFVLDYKTNSFIQPWHSNYSMKAPHDICLAENGTVIFVAELHLKTVVKFSVGNRPIELFTNIVHKQTFPHEITFKMAPTYIGLIVFLTVVSIIICLLIVQLFNRYTNRGNRIKRYGPKYKDREGFEPLTQHEDNDNVGDSDPETEEFSAPTSRITKKPKA